MPYRQPVSVPASVAVAPAVVVPLPAPAGGPPAPRSSALTRLRLGYAPRLGVRRRGRVLTALDPQPGERILEIGPGAGYHSVAIARAIGPEGRLMLVDHDSAMLDATLRRLRRRALHARVGGSLADASRPLPFGDGAYDAALLVGVLDGLADRDGALDEVARVLRPGGRIVRIP